MLSILQIATAPTGPGAMTPLADVGLATYWAVPLRAFGRAAVLQASDLAAALDASAPIRALAAFLSSTLFGGFVIYAYGGRLAAAVEGSTASLPLSALYGFVGYGLVVFLVAFAYTQIASLGLGTPAVTVLGGVLLGGGVLALSGFGFAVIGTWLTDLFDGGDPWLGLVGAGLVGAAAVLVLPLLVGAVVWFGVAAVGVGGPVRRWVHADSAERQAEEH